MLNRFLFKRIDNGPLVIFRIIFGLLLFAESIGAIFTGWVKRVLIDPQFTFSFIGFEWLQPLDGNGMYFYFILMGICGLGVMLGYRYRLSIVLFTVLWTLVYLMQKSSYNNHYYLLILLSFLMILMPANRYASLDVKRKPALKSLTMPNWCSWTLILQMGIAYTYGALAKLYPDWLDGTFIRIAFSGFADTPVIGQLFQQNWFHLFISYSGFFFDLLIIPLLLFKPTRWLAFGSAVFFHLFNSAVFQIGIFPYLSLAFVIFFFEPEKVNALFLKKKSKPEAGQILIPSYSSALKVFLSIYFLIQLLLPIRHWVIPGNVFWTEEGHRMSWRMMLRSKSSYVHFKVKNKLTGKVEPIRLGNYLTEKQDRKIGGEPDMIWQFAQRLKNIYHQKSEEVEVYADARLSLNGRQYAPLTDPQTDLAATPWQHFSHASWIQPFPGWEKD